MKNVNRYLFNELEDDASTRLFTGYLAKKAFSKQAWALRDRTWQQIHWTLLRPIREAIR